MGGEAESETGSSTRSVRPRRSKIAASTQRRNRLRSYVSPAVPDPRKSDVSPDSADHVYQVEEAARALVCKYEEARGRTTEQMPPTHPGYDVKSFGRRGELARLIEVKGIDGEWLEFGVGVKRRQFSEAWDAGDGFWLYVVEFARDPERACVYPIQNPAMKVDEFFFDQNWRAVAELDDDDLRAAYIAGARVRHHIFGYGTILNRTDRGHSVQLGIDFDRGGAKLLALNLTQFELVSSEE